MRRVTPEYHILAEGLEFPEGPVALADGSVLFVEIAGGRVGKIMPDGQRSTLAELGGGPNGLAVGPDGMVFVCNNGGYLWNQVGAAYHMTAPLAGPGRIEVIDAKTGAFRTLYDRCGDRDLSGPNDLVFDREGGFYFSDYGKLYSWGRHYGGIYYAKADGSDIRCVAYPVLSPNGVALSPDEQTLYVADTETGRLWAFDLAAPGVIRPGSEPGIHGGRVVARMPGYQKFDSMAVQADGKICVGTLISGAITVIDPAGEIVRQVMFDDGAPTNICFGGKDMTLAYVSLSATGRLISLIWDEPGHRLNYQGSI